MYVETLSWLLSWYFSSCLERTDNHQRPQHLSYAWTFWTIYTQPIQNQQIHLSKGLYTYPRTSSASPFPTPLSVANENSSKKTDMFLLPTYCMKEPCRPQASGDVCLLPLALLLGVHLDCMSQDLVLFLDSIWLNKPFLSGKKPQKTLAWKTLVEHQHTQIIMLLISPVNCLSLRISLFQLLTDISDISPAGLLIH